jgi:NAD(P)-dependent dehydrogenase (short-subunit alcohol dehydrogenase family)
MLRNVVITGGTGFLGNATVNKFIEQGDQVIVLDIREAQSDNENLVYYKVDLLNEKELSEVANKIEEEFGPIDVLINIAGGFDMSNIKETSFEQLDKMFSLNLKSAFNTSKVFINQLEKSQNGRIINIGARAGLNGVGGMIPYSISKASVISFTQGLSDELKHTDITVNAIVPSTIDTEANRNAMPDADFSNWVSPESLANVIIFISSEEASSIRGAIIPVYNKS